MKPSVTKTVCALFLGLAIVACAAEAPKASPTQDPNGVRTYYEKYRDLQDFYPMGVYGLFSGWNGLAGDKTRGELSFELYARYNINAAWYTTPFMKPQNPGGQATWPDPANPELSELGRWFYGELCPKYGVRSLVGLAPWLRFTELKPRAPTLYRQDPLATDAELAPLEKELSGVFAYCRQLRKDYPQSVMGFITDDEPHMVAMSEAGYRLVYRNLDAPPMTCNPTFSGVKALVPSHQPLTADWYMNHLEGWKMAPQMRWLNENYPGAVTQLMLWATGSLTEWNEAVLPGLRDSRPWRNELRLQMWQAVALGAKGLWAFLPGYVPGFSAGGPALTDCLLEPDPVHGHMAEWGAVGETMTAIGPLLLPCRSEVSTGVKITCGNVRYRPYFEGPAVDCGLLKDLVHNRFFVIPWNNDVDRDQTATLALPPELLNGRNVYDLMELKEIVLTNGNQLSVSLVPGGGRIFLVAPATEFDLCRNVIGKHRSQHARLLAEIELRQMKACSNGYDRIDVAKADESFAKAAECAKKKDWFQALALYDDARKAALQAATAYRPWVAAQAQLKRMAQVLSATDALFRGHLQLLEIPFDRNHVPTVYASKQVGKEIKDWAALASQYFSLLRDVRAGERGLTSIADTASSLASMAEANKAAVEAVIARRLAEVRSPLRLALITEDRTEPENSVLYTWAYANFAVDWFAPDAKGVLRDGTGKEPDISRYDAVLIHQLSYREEPAAGAAPDPAKVLLASLIRPEAVKAFSGFVQNGGGLVLSGVAGLYVLPLGLEKELPDQLHQNDYVDSSFGIGLAAAPGYSRHPAFKGLTAEGFFTNGNWPKTNLMTECAWKKKAPAGRVIATEFDVAYGPMDPYAAVVEYPAGKGKVMVLGGRACDFTPMVGFSLPHKPGEPSSLKAGNNLEWNNLYGLRERLRLFARNAIEYAAAKDVVFAADANEAGKAQAERTAAKEKREREEGIELPPDNWLFRPDPKDIGQKENWFASTLATTDWKPLRVGICWDAQGYENLTGFAWYRRSVQLANQPGKKTFLRFGAVDEAATVYLDGKLVGSSNTEWDKPFEFDITAHLTDATSDHLVAVRVYNRLAAGGIWKPISVRYAAPP